jgi:putative ABC transport system permease protein
MNMLLKVGYRNILRNRRRSAMTALAVAVGAQALVLFGGFQSYVFAGLETSAVQRSGHLTVFREGYFRYGSGNPVAYAIDDYRGLMHLIAEDPVLKPLLAVVTPTQSLAGIAGNYSGGESAAKTFLGTGFIPADRARMRLWNERRVEQAISEPALPDDDPAVGFVGLGLGRIMGLCGPLHIADCPPAPLLPAEAPVKDAPAEDFGSLQEESGDARDTAHRGMPRLDLLAATANGAPNVVGFYVRSANPQGVRELDDNVIGMHLALAQQLVYGRGEPKATGIVLQLHRTEDLPRAQARLAALFKEQKLPLEVVDFTQLNPFFVQVRQFFGSIFLFIALIMGVIVLFTIINTMTMAVLERTPEVGTTRALGVRRGGIRRQFLVEGAILGAAGAVAGIAIGVGLGLLINRAGLTWTPPANAQAVPFRIALDGRAQALALIGLALTLVATIAAWIPANRAARLPIVEALRHV